MPEPSRLSPPSSAPSALLALVLGALCVLAPPASEAADVNLFPLLRAQGKGEDQDSALQVVWPIVDNQDTEEDELNAVRPFFSYYRRDRDEKKALDFLWPLVRFSWRPDGPHHARLLPVVFWGEGESVNYQGLPAALMLRIENREGHGQLIWLGLGGHYETDEGDSFLALGPFWRGKTGEKDWTVVAPAKWETDPEGLDSLIVFPFFWWKDKGRSLAFFPFFGKHKENTFFLFPLYLKHDYEQGVVRHFLWPFTRFSDTDFNLALFWRKQRKDDNGEALYSTHGLFPFYTAKSRASGSTDFTVLDPLWFFGTAQGEEDHLSLLAKMIQWRSTPKGESSVSLLWGVFAKRKTSEGSMWRLFPFVKKSTSRQDGGSKLSILGGLFRLKKTPSGTRLNLLFMPVYKSNKKAETTPKKTP
jgi:hypothetical protein